MTRVPKKVVPRPKHVGGDVGEYFRARDAVDPEFAAASREEREKLLLARRIRELRENLGLSQAQLAEKLGTQQPSIARLESGQTLPRLDFLLRLASALDMRLSVEFVPLDAPRSGRRR